MNNFNPQYIIKHLFITDPEPIMQGFKEVDPSFVIQAAAQGAHLIDVRTEAEVAQGVIDGAVHIPLHLLPLRAADVPQDKPVVIYCRSGARSAQACAFMAAQGFSNMHNLAGGIMSWARSGHALSAPQQNAFAA